MTVTKLLGLMFKLGYIYKITNQVNGKVYIGKTINLDGRWYKHRYLAQRGSKRHLYLSMRKYGLENFSFDVIEECNNDSLNDREKYWISVFDSTNPEHGYNKTIGGDGGDTWSLNDHKENTSKRLSEKLKGRLHDPESYRRAGEKRRGFIMSDDQKNKISNSLRDGYRTGRIKIIPPPFHYDRTGSHHTDTAKEKISKARRGKTYREIYGDNADQMIKQRRDKWIGEGNPNYKDVSVDEIIRLIKLGYQNKQISNMLGISTTTVWNKLKANGLNATTIRNDERNLL